jgi:hypothetical protein
VRIWETCLYVPQAEFVLSLDSLTFLLI